MKENENSSLPMQLLILDPEYSAMSTPKTLILFNGIQSMAKYRHSGDFRGRLDHVQNGPLIYGKLGQRGYWGGKQARGEGSGVHKGVEG